MNPQRLKQLLEFYKDDPSDPFTIYGLAMEYLEEQPQESIEYFGKLLREHPGYLPTYYQAGSLYLSMNQNEQAKQILEKGMQVAQTTKDNHTYSELKSLYEEFFLDW